MERNSAIDNIYPFLLTLMFRYNKKLQNLGPAHGLGKVMIMIVLSVVMFEVIR